jgi:hypothetical protein
LLAAAGALLLLFSVACDGDDDDGATPPAGPTPNTSGVAEQNGVRLTLNIDKETYQPGETVEATATVANIADAPVNFTGRQPAEPALRLFVTTDLAGEQALEYEEASVAAGQVDVGALAPGEMIELRAAWRQDLDTYQTPIPAAPPGPYVLTAEILVQGPGQPQYSPVSTAVTARLENGPSIVTHLQAVQLSLTEPQVKDWVTSHGDSLYCTVANTGLFYGFDLETGTFSETFQQLYQDQLTAGRPICSPVTQGETWLVIFAATAGDPPNRISSTVGLYDAEVISVQLSAPTPRPVESPVPAPSP